MTHYFPQVSQAFEKITPSEICPVKGYEIDDSGVYYYTDLKSEHKRRLCSHLVVLAHTRDATASGHNWGKLVSLTDLDGVEEQWNIPMAMFATDGVEIVKGLLYRGLVLDVHRSAKRRLLEYLRMADPRRRIRLVSKMGWYKNSFVLPDRTLGCANEEVMFYSAESEAKSLCKLSERGSLAQWQENVSRYCVGNPLALFVVSAAFSAPLVDVLGRETMGFHLYGDSSWGKSTLLNVASSVYGKPDDYKKTWRATDNGIEGVAAAHSEMLLALDEINQVDSRIIDNVVYMLGNGQGKHRGRESGGATESLSWRFTFLSNGEKTLEQYLTGAGKSVSGGMEMRFIGLPATLHVSEHDRKVMGVFNHAHEFSGGAALSDHLKQTMNHSHGSAFPAFLEHLVFYLRDENRRGFIGEQLQRIEAFKAQHVSSNAGGQVIRVADKFALVALAGELATAWGITGWSPGDAHTAAVTCFRLWLNSRGGEGNLEDKQMLEHIRLQCLKHSESRFKRWDESEYSNKTVLASDAPMTAECWGFRREIHTKDFTDGDYSDVLLYVFTESFHKELCKGFDPQRIARLLRDMGALELRESERKEKRLATKERLPRMGKKPVAVYKIRLSALHNELASTDTEVDG